MKDELSDQLESSKQLIDDVRQEKNEIKRDIEILERGMLEYFNILDSLQKAAESINETIMKHDFNSNNSKVYL